MIFSLALDRIKAVVVYSYEQYKTLYPRATVHEYRDYLVSVENELQPTTNGKYQAVVVPFDPQDYQRWLELTKLADTEVTRSAWGLHVARDPDYLMHLRTKYPDCPFVARAQAVARSHLFLLIALELGSTDLNPLKSPLSASQLEHIRDMFMYDMWSLNPTFEYMSVTQVTGITVGVADRFVDPTDAHEIITLLGKWNGLTKFIELKSQFGAFHIEGNRAAITCLPVSVIGADETVRFWLNALEEKSTHLGMTCLLEILKQMLGSDLDLLIAATTDDTELELTLHEILATIRQGTAPVLGAESARQSHLYRVK